MARIIDDPATQLDLHQIIKDLMLTLHEDLANLVRIKSYAKYPDEVANARKKVVDLFTATKIERIEEIDINSISKPVYGERRASGDPSVAATVPTVLLYAHYDVQPPGDGWTVTDPFDPRPVGEGQNVRLYGRGSADDKSGICMHLAMLRAFGNALPVNLKLLIEGEEESGTGVLEKFVINNAKDPRFHADLIVIADTGNVRCGTPTVTTSLRGYISLDVTVRTLKAKVHSGMYGGPAPDAFMALVRMLATLQKDNGDVAVSLDTQDLSWAGVEEAQFRADAGILEGVDLIGTESLQKRLYGKPSISVTGLKGLPEPAEASNVLLPEVTARISVRLAPGQNPDAAFDAIKKHLCDHAPWHVTVDIIRRGGGSGFQTDPTKPLLTHAKEALREAYPGTPVAYTGQGGSIPLVNAFQQVNPKAEILMWGCEEPHCAIHAPNESVSYNELQSMTLAQALLLQKVGNQHSEDHHGTD